MEVKFSKGPIKKKSNIVKTHVINEILKPIFAHENLEVNESGFEMSDLYY